MTVQQLLSAFLAGVVGIAALSLVVAPESQTARVVNAFGENVANILSAAKAYPTTRR